MNTCGAGQEADFWFITQYVNLERPTSAEVIHVDVDAEFTLCDNPGRPPSDSTVPCYSNYFEVYIYHGTGNKASYPQAFSLNDKMLYSPLYNITKNTLFNTISNQTFSFLKNNSQDVMFAIRSKGACGTIFRMKMYYYYCEETFINGIKFEETASPAKGLKNVTGNCSDYAIPLINGTASSNRYCYENGTWNELGDENLKCFCIEGYTPNNGSCSSMFTYLYKNCTVIHLFYIHMGYSICMHILCHSP